MSNPADLERLHRELLTLLGRLVDARRSNLGARLRVTIEERLHALADLAKRHAAGEAEARRLHDEHCYTLVPHHPSDPECIPPWRPR